MFGLGAPELILILIIILAVFGAGKLAGIGGALGRSVKEFRESSGGPDATVTTKTVTNPDGSVTTVKEETKTSNQ